MIPVLAVGVAWVCIACAIATVPHRVRRATRAPSRPHWADCEPPTSVPHPDNSWMDLVPVDSLRDDDPLISERFHALVDDESWFVQ